MATTTTNIDGNAQPNKIEPIKKGSFSSF